MDIMYLEVVNKGLASGKSLVAIAKEFGKSESTIRKYLNNKGYARDKIINQFILKPTRYKR